jgi:hypothetical protein
VIYVNNWELQYNSKKNKQEKYLDGKKLELEAKGMEDIIQI